MEYYNFVCHFLFFFQVCSPLRCSSAMRELAQMLNEKLLWPRTRLWLRVVPKFLSVLMSWGRCVARGRPSWELLVFPTLNFHTWEIIKLRNRWLSIYFQYTFMHFLMYFPLSLFYKFSPFVAADGPPCVQESARRRNHCAQRGGSTPHCANGLQLGQGKVLFFLLCSEYRC